MILQKSCPDRHNWPVKLEAYGFNFDALAEAETGNYQTLLAQSYYSFRLTLTSGATVSFEKDGVTYVVELKSVSEKLYHVHVNVHYQSKFDTTGRTIKKKSESNWLNSKVL